MNSDSIPPRPNIPPPAQLSEPPQRSTSSLTIAWVFAVICVPVVLVLPLLISVIQDIPHGGPIGLILPIGLSVVLLVLASIGSVSGLRAWRNNPARQTSATIALSVNILAVMAAFGSIMYCVNIISGEFRGGI